LKLGQALRAVVRHRAASRMVTRIVALSLLLLLLVQGAGLGVVRQAIDHNIRRQLGDELLVGERIWRRLLETNAHRLRQAAMLLSADYGFRSAAASNDTATMASALDNHGARIGATVVALLDTEFEPRATHVDPRIARTPDTLLHDTAALLARESAERAGGRIVLVDGVPHQFVAVPLRSPVTIGWVVMGFPLDQAVVEDMRALSGLQVSLFAASGHEAPRLLASTLPTEQHALLAALARKPIEGLQQIDGKPLMAHTVVVGAGDAGGDLHAVLMRPVSEVSARYERVQHLLVGITVVGVLLFAFGSAWTAGRVTAPLRELVQASERLGRGDYSQPLAGTGRNDEAGDLARAFDHMRLNIATHEAQLQHLAYNDRLTGLPNRAGFRAALQQAMARRPSRGVAVIMLDLDRFKHVNDVLGYAIGDRLLGAVAARLVQQVIRRGDIVARLGGDDFALLLNESGDADALVVAERIAASLEQPLSLDDHCIDLGAGIGIACWPHHTDGNDDADALMARAEVAMYAAKKRSEVARIYDPALDSGSAPTLSLLTELRHAVERGELRLYLQPKVALAGRGVVGAEALVRWQHPQRGLVPPAEFIPFAEQTGFVRRLTLWVVEEAARHWHALQAAGSLRVSVNLSTRDLIDLELPQKLAALLCRYGVPESGLCLEITESAIMDDPARARGTLDALAALGFKLSIDDFGTGFSSLAYLRHLPVHELKIDRSFVQGLPHNSDDAKIVRSTIDLAHNLGLSVVAEGIQEEGVYGLLEALKCDEGQGYWMSRPMPLEQFVAWSRRWQAVQGAQCVAQRAADTVAEPA
jgi:diguanylate cyclase (GGDEF)-like protein